MYQRKIIPNYPNYSIDTEGQFRNESKNKLLKLAYTPSGYAYVAIINQSILRNTLVRGDYYWAKEPKNEAE